MESQLFVAVDTNRQTAVKTKKSIEKTKVSFGEAKISKKKEIEQLDEKIKTIKVSTPFTSVFVFFPFTPFTSVFVFMASFALSSFGNQVSKPDRDIVLWNLIKMKPV